VKVEAPIYDIVLEEEYHMLVARRRKETGEFINDDNELGYVDDGHEEDWSHRALPSSSDEGSNGKDGAPQAEANMSSPDPK
jgi:DNA polymerase alpha subunit A